MKRILQYTAFSLSCSIFIYLLISFIMWDILIIAKLGDYSNLDRFSVVFGYVIKEYITVMIWVFGIKDKLK